MTTNELNRFQAILTTSVFELERLTGHREGIAIERSADQVEEIQGASERLLAVCRLDRGFDQLRNARAARCRIQEGAFAKCLECDQDIDGKRVAAVPWTPFCTRCKEAFDGNPGEMPTPRGFLSSGQLEQVA